MSEADSRLLSEIFSMMQNLTRDVNDIKNEMIEANFVDLKEPQTVVEIHSQKLKAIK